MNEAKALWQTTDLIEENNKKVKRLLENMKYSINIKFPDGVPHDLAPQEIVVLSGIARRSAFEAAWAVRMAYEYGLATATKSNNLVKAGD